MKFPAHEFGLNSSYLYEVLATTLSFTADLKEFIPNTSCMGIRLIEENLIKMSPYPGSQTCKNIEETGLVCINFVDNIYLFALAALKEPKSTFAINYFPLEKYNYLNFEDFSELKGLLNHFPKLDDLKYPIIDEAWGILICEKAKENLISKDNLLGRLKMKEFYFQIRFYKKMIDSHKLFNRCENLVLEMLILATRLKAAKKQENDNLSNEIHGKILDLIGTTTRFCKNQEAIKSIDLIKKYMDYWNSKII